MESSYSGSSNNGYNQNNNDSGGSFFGGKENNINGLTSNGVTDSNGFIELGANGHTGEGSKQSIVKKWAIICIIAVVILALVALVVVSLMGGVGRVLNGDPNEKFNIFANYVMDGEEKKDRVVGGYGIRYNYYIVANKNDMNVFSKASDLFANFTKAYDSGGNKNELLELAIRDERERLSLGKIILAKPRLTEKDILDKYLEGGTEGVVSYTEEYYDFSGQNDNGFVSSFINDYSEWVQLVLERINVFDDFDCLSENGLDNYCINSRSDDDTKNRVAKNSESISEMESLLSSSYRLPYGIIAGMYNIDKLLYGENEYNDDNENEQSLRKSTLPIGMGGIDA